MRGLAWDASNIAAGFARAIADRRADDLGLDRLRLSESHRPEIHSLGVDAKGVALESDLDDGMADHDKQEGDHPTRGGQASSLCRQSEGER